MGDSLGCCNDYHHLYLMKYLWIWILPAGVDVVVLLRVSAFKRDRPSSGPFGVPILQPFKQLDPDSYTDAGKRLLPWHWVCGSLAAVAIFILAVLNSP